MKIRNLKCTMLIALISIQTIVCNSQEKIIQLKEVGIASLPSSFNWEPGIALPSGWINYGMGVYSTGHDAPNAGKFDTQGDSLVIHFNQAATSLSYYIKGYSIKPPYVFNILQSIDGITYTTLQTHTDSVNMVSSKYVKNTLYPLPEARYVKFEYAARKGGNIALDEVVLLSTAISTSITDAETDVSVYVYPNPVNNILYVQSYACSFDAIVYDLLGTMIVKRSLGQYDATEINTAHFKTGLYLVSIKQGEHVVKTIKVIKR